MAEYSKEQKAEWARKGYWRNRDKILRRNKTKAVRAYKAAWNKKTRKLNLEQWRAKEAAWPRRNRQLWLNENGPCKECGSHKRLEIDHIDPKNKVHHSIWTWSKVRRKAELNKCQVLCFLCHRLKTNRERGWSEHGETRYQTGCRCTKCVKVHKKKLRANRRLK